MAVIEIARIQVRRGQENQTGVPQLEAGEFGWAQDTERLYIGKRIAEGAADDTNTRILTENDVNNIFDLLSVESTATILTPYKYRSETPYISSSTVARFIQNRLEEEVYLTDFGVTAGFTGNDITNEFQKAVETIFFNTASNWSAIQRIDSRRKLKIPAGIYTIQEAIELPPYALIEGEGQELTTIRLTSSATNIFKTIDAEGNDYKTGSMASGAKRSRQVVIKNMTLEYAIAGLSNTPLIALDNVLDATVENCILRTTFSSTSTTTYGVSPLGIGIEIRGTGGGLGSGDVNLCENPQIKNCKFDGLYLGVRSTGTVIKPQIDNSYFSNLNRGIEFYTINALPGPSNGYITDNRFENIVREAIYIGPNQNSYRGNHVIANNFFVQVGNGPGLDDRVTTSAYAIISANASGNQSFGNAFQRKNIADVTTSTTFYYNPLITGQIKVQDGSVFTATISALTTGTVTRIPVNGQDQFIDFKYQMKNPKLSRKGTLIVNLAPDGYAALTDTYNYIESYDPLIDPTPPEIYFKVDASKIVSQNFIELKCVNTATNSTSTSIDFQYDIIT